MSKDIKDLSTVKNYSHKYKVSTAAVYNWLKKGVLEGLEIDGVKFVVNTKKNDNEIRTRATN